jgi:hypothetical protein
VNNSIKNLVFGLLLIFLFSAASAYTIDGEKVVYENQFARLTIFPHTSADPTNRHRQFFFLENKKDETYQDVRIGYIFDEKPTGDIFKYSESEWGIRRRGVIDFNMATHDWNYELLQTDLNPYHVTVFHFDSNSPTIPRIDFESNCADSNIVGGKRRFYIDYNLIVVPPSWDSIKHKFTYFGKTSFGEYYYSDPFDVQPFKSYLWLLDYQTEAKTGKWALIAFKGDINCFLDDSCDKFWYIDPWWDTDYLFRRPLSLTNNNYVVAQDSNVPVKIHIKNEFGAKALSNCADVRIVYDFNGVQTELDRNTIGNCQSDANIYFDINRDIAAYGTDANYWVFYGNAGALTPTGADLVNGSPDSKSTTYCPADTNTGQYSPNLSGTGSNNLCMIAGAMALSEGIGTKGEKGIIRTGAAIGWFDGNFISVGLTGYTIEFWVYLNSSSKQRFAGFSVNVPADNVQFIIEDSPAPVSHLRVVALQDGVVLHDLDSRVVPSFSQWHHLQYSCGSLGAKLYLDWNLIASSANVQCISQGPGYASFTLGAPNGVVSEFSTSGAKFDELRISANYQRSFRVQKDFNAASTYPTAALGAEEELSVDFDPLVDVNYPNGGEVINLYADPVIPLKIRITNDQNWALVDLNYSALPILGTGTVIALDINSENSPFFTCESDYNDANVGSLCEYIWDATGTPDGNYYLIAEVSDDTGNSNFDISDYDFNLYTITQAFVPITGGCNFSAGVDYDSSIPLASFWASGTDSNAKSNNLRIYLTVQDLTRDLTVLNSVSLTQKNNLQYAYYFNGAFQEGTYLGTVKTDDYCMVSFPFEIKAENKIIEMTIFDYLPIIGGLFGVIAIVLGVVWWRRRKQH